MPPSVCSRAAPGPRQPPQSSRYRQPSRHTGKHTAARKLQHGWHLNPSTLLAFLRKSSVNIQSYHKQLLGFSGGEAQYPIDRPAGTSSRRLRIPAPMATSLPLRRGYWHGRGAPSGEAARAAGAARGNVSPQGRSQERAPTFRWAARGSTAPVPGPSALLRVEGPLKALPRAFLLRARKRPRCSRQRHGAAARRLSAHSRAERGASAWAVENRARAWPRVYVYVCVLVMYVCTQCESIPGSLFWRPRSTQRTAASASETGARGVATKIDPSARGLEKSALARPCVVTCVDISVARAGAKHLWRECSGFWRLARYCP